MVGLEAERIRVYEALINYANKGLKNHDPMAVLHVVRVLVRNRKGLIKRVKIGKVGKNGIQPCTDN